VRPIVGGGGRFRNAGRAPKAARRAVLPQRQGGTDHFAALNAWDDPSISGPEASFSQGYGGFQALDTMQGTKINNYLNQFSVGGDREQAMNALGYFNQGNPFNPGSMKGSGVNKQARASAASGQMTAPGIYQQQAMAPKMGPGGTPDLNSVGGYLGATTVDPGGAAKYTAFGAGGAGKFAPRPPTQPHNQIGQMGKGTGHQAGQPYPGRPGGRPVVKKGGGGGGFKPGGFPQQTGGAKKGPGGGGGAGFAGQPGLFPKQPPTPPNFLPMTPGYEAAYRGANDQLAAAEGSYAASGAMIPAQLQQAQARLRTDQDVATDRLKEQLAARGIYTPYSAEHTIDDPRYSTSPAGGGVGQALYNRSVATPYGREFQDLGAAGAQAYQDRSQQYGGAQLGFNQAMLEALLGRAGDAFEAQPLSLPIGGYELPQMPGPSFSNPPGGGGGKKGPGKNRQRNGGRRKNRPGRR
jgi:hypothetical protein